MRDRLSAGRGWAGADPWAALMWLLAACALGAYTIVFLGRVRGIDVSILWHSDSSGTLVVTQTLAAVGPGHSTVVSTTGDWLDLWYGLITAHLPLHRELWVWGPAALTTVAAIAIGRSVWRLGGAVAGVIAGLLIWVATPRTLSITLAPAAHNTVYVTTALLGGLLPWLLRTRIRSRPAWAAMIVAGAVLLGTDLASDELVLITGFLPLVLCACLALAQPERRMRLIGAGVLLTVALAVPADLLTSAVMHSAGYSVFAPSIGLAGITRWATHWRLLVQSVLPLTGGYLVQSLYEGPATVPIGVASIIVLFGATAVLVGAGLRAAWQLASRRLADPAQLARELWIAFWFLSAVLSFAAFIGSSAPKPYLGTEDSSFVLPIVIALFAVTPLFAGGSRLTRVLAPAALAVFAFSCFVGIQRQYFEAAPPPLASFARTIVRDARRDDATTGYAGYFDASNLTWMVNDAVRVRPIEQCARASSRQSGICPFYLGRTSSWYVPHRRRTFLLVDPANTYVTTLPRGLGRPLARYQIGSILMYVYPYDLARRMS